MRWAIFIGIVILIAITLAIVKRNELMDNDFFKNRRLLRIGEDYPIIWLYYDSSQVNSRKWSDFMARSSRVIHEPFLNLCYNSIVKKNGQQYRVEVIGGLEDLAMRLGGWEALPGPLRSPIADVTERDLNWIRAAVLAKWGGLWLHPSTICIGGFGKLPKDKIIGFGSDPWEERGESSVPSLRAIWAPRAEMPEFVSWAAAARNRVESHSSNSEIRRDEVWDWKKFCEPTAVQMAGAELNRKRDGRRIEIEDLLMAGQGGDMPISITEETIYIPIPWKEIQRRSVYGWFLRMSEEQVMESDLVVKHLFLV